MSDLVLNKIAAAALATALVIVGLGEVSSAVYKSEPAAKPGYIVQVAADTSAPADAAATDTPPDWGTVLPIADVAAGKADTAVCQACHNFEKGGPNMTGPNLYGVLGRKPGSHPGFSYSQGMIDEGNKIGAWGYDQIEQFIKGPQAYVQGTKMGFVGLKKQQDRINVIAYLRTINDSPPPIPAPKPAAAVAPGAAGAAPSPASPVPAAGSPAPSGPSTAPTGPAKPLPAGPSKAPESATTTIAPKPATPPAAGSAPKP
jgi:cytochrome c